MNIDISNVLENINIIEDTTYIIKMFFISICTYYTVRKVTNSKPKNKITSLICGIFMLLITFIILKIKNKTNSLISIITLNFLLTVISCKATKNKFGYTLLATTMSMSINYIIFAISISIMFIPNALIVINNNFLNLVLMMIIHSVILYKFFKRDKIKYGFSFFRKEEQNGYLDLIILNISVSVLFSIIILSNIDLIISRSLFIAFIIFAIIMFITIKKSFNQYYKQKLLEQELSKVRTDLEEKTKEVEELEAENIRISKNAHTLVHKQKSLAHKLDEMMLRTEISAEEAAEVRDRLAEIGKDLYKEKTTTELDKTEIPEIDDMLKYMQSECSANKIEFELQLKGNIHHMTNNLISKVDLETLLADHIKNAIIAINHTDNPNRSILVKLGKIDETYGLYIYDSGIEFEKETLENLGKKPSTTHKDEGGTGMGFMNTFDTLKKCKASLVIEQFGKPDKDNYTKVIMFKFDNKNEIKIK